MTFVDIDECSSVPCQHSGTCTDHLNAYNCSCNVAYTGVQCETGTYTLNRKRHFDNIFVID